MSLCTHRRAADKDFSKPSGECGLNAVIDGLCIIHWAHINRLSTLKRRGYGTGPLRDYVARCAKDHAVTVTEYLEDRVGDPQLRHYLRRPTLGERALGRVCGALGLHEVDLYEYFFEDWREPKDESTSGRSRRCLERNVGDLEAGTKSTRLGSPVSGVPASDLEVAS